MSEQDDILAANAAYYEAFASADFGKMSHAGRPSPSAEPPPRRDTGCARHR